MRPPHRFPFELVDRIDADGGRTLATAGSWWLRGEHPWTLPWLVEASAQAAAALLGRPSPGAPRWALAAIDRASLDRPVGVGEQVELRVRMAGRLGGLVRIESELISQGSTIGRMELTLASASTAGDPRTGRP